MLVHIFMLNLAIWKKKPLEYSSDWIRKYLIAFITDKQPHVSVYEILVMNMA